MAAFQVRLLRAAVEDLERLDRAIARRVVRRLEWLAEHLEQLRLEPLQGDLAGLYKLRVGDYRVIL
ncbi:type II toxin-antitoxin system RelE family toxin [Rhodothermus marinus]|uniref:type II toxin-antitoxin system RelE family toxin n=1 Tax=Rhodothermus marinus TaxID=29549 RepID=UPI0018D959C3|nr:type II toxin-antitoxin system RelE/ParE family toxin [Rhodothermus marinus]